MIARVHRLTHLIKFEIKDAALVEYALINSLKPKGLPVLTITADNGRELLARKNAAHKIEANFCFAHLYSLMGARNAGKISGLVRQYLSRMHRFHKNHTD